MRILRTLWLAATFAVVMLGMHSTANSLAPSAPMTRAPSDAHAGGDGSTDARDARNVLERLKGTYRHLDGVTVTMGFTPNGEQAVAYYTGGRIVIDRAHTASIDAILAHEVWHIIDWRDNGQLDWGEQVPPRAADTYLAR